MWASRHDINIEDLGVLRFLLRLMESAFLLSLLLSAALLLMRSRWAIILGIAQLPVRVLCGFSLLPFYGLARALEGADSLQLWFFIALTFDLLRIGATVAILRFVKPQGQAHVGLPLSLRRALPAGTSVLAMVLGLQWWAHLRPGLNDSPSSVETVESVLATIDGKLFFFDRGTRPGRHSAIAVSWQGGERPGSAEIDTLKLVQLEPHGMRTVMGWRPACGPWNLEHLMAFELGLFSRPWSGSFGGVAWTDKTIVPMQGGYRMRFVPADSLAGPADLYTPVVRGFQVWVDSTGVPRQGFCELDMQLFPAQATLSFEFEDHGEELRIHRIVNQIDIANVSIVPRLDLRYREEDGFVSLDGADFFVALEQLSPSLGHLMGGDQATRLRWVHEDSDLAKAP